MQEISLYFHIPFCTKKCGYCHFFVLPDKESFKRQLLASLRQEFLLWQPELLSKKIVSIYFGGGTPALIGPTAIESILSWIPHERSIEITLEANPENISQQLMRAYADVGINRLSIGVQTLHDPLLHRLGRTHNATKALDAIEAASLAGLDNISIDLMYDLPGQTLEIWQKTLAQVESLPISHLSLYNLTIEPHTAFFKYRREIEKQMPDPEISLAMYQQAQSALTRYGLAQYEISAFAKEGKTAQHNSGYWTGRPFLGFGPSAFSYWKGRRFRNVAHLNQYSRALEKGELPIDFDEELSPDNKMRELLAIHLRLLEGISLGEFQKQHGEFDQELHQTLIDLQNKDYLHVTANHRLALTQKGILFYDSLASEIV